MLPLLASGLLNKQVAFELGITEWTVQLHRGHIMRKMHADSFAGLVRMADKLSPDHPILPDGALTSTQQKTMKCVDGDRRSLQMLM